MKAAQHSQARMVAAVKSSQRRRAREFAELESPKTKAQRRDRRIPTR